MASSAILSEDAEEVRDDCLASILQRHMETSLITRNVGGRQSKGFLRLRLYVALFMSDAICVSAAFLAANVARWNNPFHSHGIDLLTLILPVFLCGALSNHAYSLDALKQPRLGLRRAAQSLAFALAAVIGMIFYLKASEDYSRVVMAAGTGGAFALVLGMRWLIGATAGKRWAWRFTNELLIVDEVPMVPRRGDTILFADNANLAPATDDPHLLDSVGRLLRNCDRVVVACPPERRNAWSGMLKGTDIDVEVLSPELEQMGALAMGHYDGKSTVLVSRGPLGLRDRILKRVFDLTLSVPALLLMAPLFVLIAIAIKLDSRGPVFFRQPRVGLGNRLFEMYKFRSMRIDMLDANGSKLTQVGDARVTKVGDFLRRTSLDELPQLINVLMGDMSIAGPRPHPTGALAGETLYWEVDSRYWHRHAVKPGMTGLAQVRGFRGTTFQHSDLTNRLQADLEYLSGWSIWRDIGIVFATMRVATHKNAF